MRIIPASLAAACLSGSCDPLTEGGGDGELCQFILKGVWDDGVVGVVET